MSLNRFFRLCLLLLGLGGSELLSASPVYLTPELTPYLNGAVRALAVQADRRILVAGGFDSSSIGPCDYLARFGPGVLSDPSFRADLNGPVTHLALAADGKIIVAGEFTAVDSVFSPRIGRLNTDGSRDSSFSGETSNLPGPVSALLLKPDGKILVAGATSAPAYWVRQLLPGGKIDTAFAVTVNGRVDTLALEADGRILLGGDFTAVNSDTRVRLARINAQGDLDPTFTPVVNGAIFCLRIQPDGQILLGGDFTEVANVTRPRLARLEADGDIASDFYSGVEATVRTVELQADGGILLGGDFADGVRLLAANGSLARSYLTDYGVSIRALSLEHDGRLLIGGAASSALGYLRRAEAAVAPQEALDLSAANSLHLVRGGGLPEVDAVAFDRWDGGAWITLGSGARTPTDWTLSDIPPGTGAWYRVRASDRAAAYHETVIPLGDVPDLSVADSDGAILADGGATGFGDVDWLGAGGLRTLTITNQGTGQLTGLAVSLVGIHPEAFVLTAPALTALAPGASTTIGIRFVPQGGGLRRATLRVSSNDYDERDFAITLEGRGVRQDASLQPDFGSGGFVRLFSVGPDNSIVVGGRFTEVNGHARPYLARFDPSGNLDTSFAPTLGGWIYGLKHLPDGRILVFLDLAQAGGVSNYALFRLLPDGQIDPSFAGPANLWINTFEVLPDGKLILATTVTDSIDRPCAQLMRLHADGGIDETFDRAATTSGPYDLFIHLVPLSDGKILVTGRFNQLQGAFRSNIARFHPDGMIDSSFALDVNIPEIDTVAVQGDGKILLAGGVKNIDFQAVNGLIRLESNGALDVGFDLPDYHGNILAVQADGGILMTGTWNEGVGSAIERLNPDGSRDAAFHLGSDGAVVQLAPTVDGKLVAYGYFSELGGAPRDQLGRVPNLPAATQALSAPNPAELRWQRGGCAPEVPYARFERWNGTGWSPLGNGRRMVGGWSLAGLDLGSAGLVRASSVAPNGVTVAHESAYNFTGAELTPLQTWRVDHFGTPLNSGAAASLADPDQDGVANLLEYAFGTDPRHPGSRPGAPTITHELIDGAKFMTVSWTRSGGAADVLCEPECSEDLQTWEYPSSRLSIIEDAPFRLTVRMSLTEAPAFLRLRVSEE